MSVQNLLIIVSGSDRAGAGTRPREQLFPPSWNASSECSHQCSRRGWGELALIHVRDGRQTITGTRRTNMDLNFCYTVKGNNLDSWIPVKENYFWVLDPHIRPPAWAPQTWRKVKKYMKIADVLFAETASPFFLLVSWPAVCVLRWCHAWRRTRWLSASDWHLGLVHTPKYRYPWAGGYVMGEILRYSLPRKRWFNNWGWVWIIRGVMSGLLQEKQWDKKIQKAPSHASVKACGGNGSHYSILNGVQALISITLRWKWSLIHSSGNQGAPQR